MLKKNVQEVIKKQTTLRLTNKLSPLERGECETILLLLQEIERRDEKIEKLKGGQ